MDNYASASWRCCGPPKTSESERTVSAKLKPFACRGGVDESGAVLRDALQPLRLAGPAIGLDDVERRVRAQWTRPTFWARSSWTCCKRSRVEGARLDLDVAHWAGVHRPSDALVKADAIVGLVSASAPDRRPGRAPVRLGAPAPPGPARAGPRSCPRSRSGIPGTLRSPPGTSRGRARSARRTRRPRNRRGRTGSNGGPACRQTGL